MCSNKGAIDPENPTHPTPEGGPAADISFSFAEVGLHGAAYTVRDVWTATEVSVSSGMYTAKAVPNHGTALFRVSEKKHQ